MGYEIKQGDALTVLRSMPDESVQVCVTSPPYFNLRDYGIDGQIGLEDTPRAFVESLVAVFEEVRRVLRKDGTCWVNLGDSYSGSMSTKTSAPDTESLSANMGQTRGGRDRATGVIAGLKAKDLIGIPWRVAFALQDAGWYLRQDIIWNKPNPMPESVTDRCTKSHEYIFLLSKSAKYYFDQDAIREPLKDASIARLGQDVENQEGSDRVPGKTNGKMKAVLFGGNNRCPDTRLQSGKAWQPKSWKGSSFDTGKTAIHQLDRAQKGRDRSNGNRNGKGASTLDIKGYEHRGDGDKKLTGHSGNFDANGDLIGDGTANKKSVWTVSTRPFKEAHFATFPEKLIEPCILAGSKEGDTVLDPFNGAGTSGLVSLRHKRNYIGIELNPEYIEISERRLKDVQVELF